MAGEIHNFDSNKKRKRPKWSDDRSSDKYYDSGDKSAVGDQSSADSSVKPGEKPRGVKHVGPKQDDRRADKYYANPTQPAPTKQQLERGLGKPPRLVGERRAAEEKRQPRAAKHARGSVTLKDQSEVNGAMQDIAERLNSGEAAIVVYVERGNSQLLRRARAALEMLVTREVITEDQYRDVRLSYTLGEGETAALNEKLGPPVPRETVSVDDSEDVGDLDFLSGLPRVEEPEIDITPSEVREVDTSDDEPSQPPTEADTSDEDDSDFLTGGQESRVTAGGYELESTEFTSEGQLKVGKPTQDEVFDTSEMSNMLKQVNNDSLVAGLRDTRDELDRAVETDKPVKTADADREDSEEAAEDAGDGVSADSAMDGVGDAPPAYKGKKGRRSGRGSK